KQGDRSLHDIFKALAIRQLVVHRGTKTPRNPLFHEYFHRKLAEGKTKKQAIICIMRRLVNIVYGILKSKTVYRLPEPLKQAK
ncbi:IS110 family transposase, partial [Paenibacillus sp. SI92]